MSTRTDRHVMSVLVQLKGRVYDTQYSAQSWVLMPFEYTRIRTTYVTALCMPQVTKLICICYVPFQNLSNSRIGQLLTPSQYPKPEYVSENPT